MKLSRVERWILANQYKILEALYPQEAASYARDHEALVSGYELEYSRICEFVYRDEYTLSEEDCREVIDTMAMFDAIKRSYGALDDKTDIDPKRLSFLGFDGNNETCQMAYARYYCEAGRFEGLDKGDNFNSHWPMLPTYRAMLKQWRESKDRLQLNKADLVRITSAIAQDLE